MDTAVMVALVSLVGTAVVGVLTYRSSRSATDVNRSATDVQWVQQARSDADSAQQRAAAAEAKTEEIEARLEACLQRLRLTELRIVTAESKEAMLTARLRYIVQMIHDPYQTLDQLRQRIPAGFGAGDNEGG